MRKFLIRLALLILYLLAALVNFTILASSYDIWSCGLAAMFATATVLLTGRARYFVLLPVFYITCIFPISALSWLARPLYGSWAESFSGIISSIVSESPLHGFELILPLFSAAIAAFNAQRWSAKRDQPGA